MDTDMEVFLRLQEISKLEKDWDSYDGDPPTPLSLHAAQQLIIEIHEDCNIWPYFIAPICDGGVLIEWRNVNEGLCIEVDVGPKDFSYLLMSNKIPRDFEEHYNVRYNNLVVIISKTISLKSGS